MASLHVGFIGAGFIAERHFSVLQSEPDVVIAAVADPGMERAQTLADRAGARLR